MCSRMTESLTLTRNGTYFLPTESPRKVLTRKQASLALLHTLWIDRDRSVQIRVTAFRLIHVSMHFICLTLKPMWSYGFFQVIAAMDGNNETN